MDILKIYADTFINFFSFLQVRGSLSIETLNMDFESLPDEVLIIYHLLVQTDLYTSTAIAGDVIDHLKKINQADDHLVFLYNELTRSILRELGSRYVLLIPSNRDKYYESYLSDKEKEIGNKTPEIIEDIIEAGNCFAFGRYTACVFHLIRVMEKSVQYFGKKLKIFIKKAYNR